MTPEQLLRYDIGRLMVEYKEKYDKLKAFKTDFKPSFIKSIQAHIDSLHTPLHDDEEQSLHHNLHCNCSVTDFLVPSFNTFTHSLNKFTKAFEQAKVVSIVLSDIYKKVCDCCENQNKENINIDDFRQSIKSFYHLSFAKAFEKAFKEMKQSITLYDIYVNNDILYNRRCIEVD